MEFIYTLQMAIVVDLMQNAFLNQIVIYVLKINALVWSVVRSVYQSNVRRTEAWIR